LGGGREHRSFERTSPFEAQGKQDKREIPPLRKPTIHQEDEWEEKVGLLRSE
jgi:hypothetical protein